MIDQINQPEGESLVPLEARRHGVVHEIGRGFRMACEDQRPGPVVLAVSGGRDSLALLIAAVVLRDHDDWSMLPRVVHVHHHLRPEADEEAALPPPKKVSIAAGASVLSNLAPPAPVPETCSNSDGLSVPTPTLLVNVLG